MMTTSNRATLVPADIGIMTCSLNEKASRRWEAFAYFQGLVRAMPSQRQMPRQE